MEAGSGLTSERGLAQVRLLNIGELRKDSIGALTFGAEIPPYKDGMLPSSPKMRYAYPTAPTWQVVLCPHLWSVHCLPLTGLLNRARYTAALKYKVRCLMHALLCLCVCYQCTEPSPPCHGTWRP